MNQPDHLQVALAEVIKIFHIIHPQIIHEHELKIIRKERLKTKPQTVGHFKGEALQTEKRKDNFGRYFHEESETTKSIKESGLNNFINKTC